MSLRSFTVYQDEPTTEVPQAKASRPGVLVTRPARLAVIDDAAVAVSEAVINKENLNPLTGERAGAGSNGAKKRKVLATKISVSTGNIKSKKAKEAHAEPEPELKKRKASISSTTKARSKKEIKGSASIKKSGTNRSTKKALPMPKVNEEVEGDNLEHITQADIDARVYELTVKPLADVSEAYEEFDVFESITSSLSGAGAAEPEVKFGTVKELSVEPELRDYYQPSKTAFSGSMRLRALSEDVPEGRTFSTPERKAIYAAFTFSSPSSTAARPDKASPSNAELI